MDVRVEPVDEVTDELAAGMRILLPQLSSSAPPLTRAALAEVVACSTNTVLAAWSGDRLVGTSTLVVFPIPSGVRAWVEDVVVDTATRGHGVGAALRDSKVYRLTL